MAGSAAFGRSVGGAPKGVCVDCAAKIELLPEGRWMGEGKAQCGRLFKQNQFMWSETDYKCKNPMSSGT